ncbi:MAG TPA: ABC transporter substrate-binding protein [Polyangiales bacterium]|nr:ABC transporter substrate-binding protein [Polyangiales bacterium]
MKIRSSGLLVLAGVLQWGASHASAEDKPSVIRISYPSVGVGGRPAGHTTSIASAHLRGLFEEEFRPDGISISWSFLRGAGPAVNELFANNLVDFSHLGDLPAVIGRASGLSYQIVAGTSVRGNVYVAAPSDSTAQTVADLRGKRIALQKGTSTHLAGVKILERFGLTEKDVKIVNMDTVNAQLALTTRDIDAAIGTTDYLRLRDQGVAKILYATKGDPVTTSNGAFLASSKFLERYPTIATRVLKVVVKSAQWLAETNPTQVFQLWTKSGTTFASFREDWKGDDVKYRTSPLIDPYLTSRYKTQITEAKRLSLTKNTFSFEEWAEPRFLQAALKQLGLEGYWQPRGLDGKPSAPDARRASNAQPGAAVTVQPGAAQPVAAPVVPAGG